MGKARDENGKPTIARQPLTLASFLGTAEPRARQPPGVILLHKPSREPKSLWCQAPSCQHHSLNQNHEITTTAQRWFEGFLSLPLLMDQTYGAELSSEMARGDGSGDRRLTQGVLLPHCGLQHVLVRQGRQTQLKMPNSVHGTQPALGGCFSQGRDPPGKP